MNVRMLPPIVGNQQAITVFGRSYKSVPGNVLDVPHHDALQLKANGWIEVEPSGPTSARPTNTFPVSGQPYALGPGFKFWDSTLGKLVVFDGATWRDPATGSAV